MAFRSDEALCWARAGLVLAVLVLANDETRRTVPDAASSGFFKLRLRFARMEPTLKRRQACA